VRAGAPAVGLSVCLAAAAALETFRPFLPAVHQWWFALAALAAGVYVLAVGIGSTLGGRDAGAALASLGGALLAAGIAFASFVGGAPERVGAAPGQLFRPPHGASVAVAFPDVTSARAWPDTVTVAEGAASTTAGAGDEVRAGAFVFDVGSGPIALVAARSPRGSPVTVTQPSGAAFLSPYLTFPAFDGDRPADEFAVPALHRVVQVDYWSGLPSRGIDIPFLALRISEQNGGTLYEGVAVSGRALTKAGVSLTFTLGTYPIVEMASAPPRVPFWAGVAMVFAGLTGYLISKTNGRTARPLPKMGGVDRASRAME